MLTEHFLGIRKMIGSLFVHSSKFVAIVSDFRRAGSKSRSGC